MFWRDTWHILAALTSGASYQGLRALAPRGFFQWALAAIVMVEVMLLGTQSLTMPYEPQGWDVYAYHWAVPQLYLLHHTIYALSGWAHANFPFNSEMLNTLAFAFASPVAATLLQETFGGCALALLMGFVYRHRGLQALWMGVALCLSSVLFTTVLVSGYADLGATYYGVASVVIVLAWIEEDEHPAKPGMLRLLFLGGLFAGFGLGTKYTEGQIVVGVMVLLVGMAIIKVVKTWCQRKPIIRVLWRELFSMLCYSMAALLPLLPWLLKDWALLGNPIYPFIWGGPEWDAARTQTGTITFAHFGPHGTPLQRLLGTWFDLFFDSRRVADTPYATPPQFFLLAALLLPLLLVIKLVCQQRTWLEGSSQEDRRNLLGLPWLVVAGGAYVAWVLSHASVARYALPWVLLLTVSATLVLAPTAQSHWRWPLLQRLTRDMRPVVLCVFLLFVIEGGPLESVSFWLNYRPLLLLTGATSLHQWEKQHLFDAGYWAMVSYVTTNLPGQDKLLLLGRGTGYFLEGRDYVDDSGEDWIPYLETEGHTPAGILRLLQQDNFRYVVYEETTLQYVIHAYENAYVAGFLPAFRQFLAGSLKQIWAYDNYHIYEVPSP